MRARNEGQIGLFALSANFNIHSRLRVAGYNICSRPHLGGCFMEREDFLHNFGQIRGRTMGRVRCIPPDKIEWTCRSGEFTLGDLARHIAATERYVFAECAVGRPSRYKGCGRELAAGLDNVATSLEPTHSDAMEIFSGMTQQDFEKKVTSPESVPITAWKLL